MNINTILPINSVSFGDCGWNIMYEFFKRDIHPNFFPINLDLSSFDKTSQDFINYLQLCSNKSSLRFKRSNPCFRLWHIQGSETSVSNDNYLFTFRELDQLSEIETNILNNQKCIFVSCEETKQIMLDHGVTSNIVYCPLGFDNIHFKKTDKKYFNDDRIVFTINGKWELRKQTDRIIKLWINKYGNNHKYYLNIAVTNPHLKPEDMQRVFSQIFENQKPPFNVNLLPYLRTRSELNDLYNCTNIVLDASLYETWSLPSFSMVALGKHAVIHNVGGVKGWANAENSVLFEPSGKEIAHDSLFFHKDKKDFGFGNWYKWEDDSFVNAMELAVKRHESNPVNEAGLLLQKKFTWKNSVDIILDEIKK